MLTMAYALEFPKNREGHYSIYTNADSTQTQILHT